MGGSSVVNCSAHQDTLENVLACDYRLDEPEFDTVSSAAKDFIARLLVTDPGERMSAQEALGHPWMVSDSSPSPGSKAAGRFVAQRRRKFDNLLAPVVVVVADRARPATT